MPSIQAVMTPFPYHVDIDAPLEEAQRLLARHDISHLPVMEGGALVGVISDRDLGLVAAAGRAGARVREACVLDAYVVELGEPLDRVLVEMARRHIGSALVAKGGKLVGIFTTTDVCRRFSDFLGAHFPEEPDDEVA